LIGRIFLGRFVWKRCRLYLTHVARRAHALADVLRADRNG
jgi:hypothetical protein